MDQQLLREFLADAEDLTEALSGDIEALRARLAEGRARRTLTGRIFRQVHTLKGAAASVELETTGQLAHEFETLLDGLRLGRVVLDEEVLDAFAEAAAALSEMLFAAARGEVAPLPEALVERLRELASRTDEGSAVLSSQLLSLLPESLTRSLSAYELQRLREAVQDGSRLFVVHINFDLPTFEQQFRALEETLVEDGEIISTSPGLPGAPPGQLGFRILYATEETRAELAARISPYGPATLAEIATGADKGQFAGDFSEASDQPSTAREFLVQPARPASSAPLTTLLRIELEELDEAIYAAHELFKKTTETLDLALSGGASGESERLLESLATDIRSRSVELEERLIALRMIPLARTLKRAVRAGLMAARMVWKEIDFEVAGEDVRLDKSLADAVSGPLLHLLRNAVDHGIESPAERKLAGKSERGRVRLEALMEGSRVRLRVSDDGRGIDPLRLAQVAREQGIIGPQATLNMREALRLIFRPGFSTASSVSSVSGRGIGLEVVEQALEQSGGELRVWSETGAGTTFDILLPTTLALVPSFLVHSANHLYCLDASHIADACLLDEKELERSGESMTYRWRNLSLPLVRLRGLLGQPQDEPPVRAGQSLHVVIAHFDAGPRILEADEQRAKRTIALAVDGWDGYRKVLVRGLGRHSARWHGIGGATELQDGRPALLLDLPRLLDQL